MGANWYCLFEENEVKLCKVSNAELLFPGKFYNLHTFSYGLTVGHLILQKSCFNELMLVKALGFGQSQLQAQL